MPLDPFYYRSRIVFFPSIYKNNTALLSPSNVFLAYKLQTRAAQRKRGERNLSVDWDFLFEAGNLQATAITKKAVAKAQTRKRWIGFKKAKI